MAKLPKLEHWPEISHLTAEDLEKLSERNNIKSLQLIAIAPDVDHEKLHELIRRSPLKLLFLQDYRLKSLESLRGKPELESLRLPVGKLSSNQLARIGSIPQLTELYMNVDGAEDLSFAPLAQMLSFGNRCHYR